MFVSYLASYILYMLYQSMASAVEAMGIKSNEIVVANNNKASYFLIHYKSLFITLL